VGGFVLDQLGFIPRGGESFEYGNYRFTVVEMDGKRVARVKVQRARPAGDRSAEGAVAAPAPDEPQPVKAAKSSRSNPSADTR
jgi:putative hemolysin